MRDLHRYVRVRIEKRKGVGSGSEKSKEEYGGVLADLEPEIQSGKRRRRR